jgi:hypothetical protein
MPRIGILIDTFRGSIPASFRGKISDYVKRLPETAFCIEEENPTSPDALNRIGKRLETGEADRVVIIGGSPKLYEISFQKFRHPLPLNPYLFAVANIREQAFWMMGEEAAVEKAKTIISKTIRSVSSSKPIENQSLPLKPEVLVLGGGITGISIAQELADAGIHVFLVEKGTHLGGKTLELHKFYNRPLEVQKWVDEKISGVRKSPQISLFTQTELKHLDGHLGRFQAKIQSADRTETVLSISGIVVATGYTARRETKGIYGHKRVIVFSEIEKLLSEATGPSFHWNGKKVEMVTYLLDGVNEERKVSSSSNMKTLLSFPSSTVRFRSMSGIRRPFKRRSSGQSPSSLISLSWAKPSSPHQRLKFSQDFSRSIWETGGFSWKIILNFFVFGQIEEGSLWRGVADFLRKFQNH